MGYEHVTPQSDAIPCLTIIRARESTGLGRFHGYATKFRLVSILSNNLSNYRRFSENSLYPYQDDISVLQLTCMYSGISGT